MQAEELFYRCCDRIDEEMEVAEPFLVGCIYYVSKEFGVARRRKHIKEHLNTGCFYPYTKELAFIDGLCDISLRALITSSLDFSCLLRQVEILYEHVKDSDYSKVQESAHTNKAEKAGKLLLDIANQMKRVTKIKHDCGLFEDD